MRYLIFIVAFILSGSSFASDPAPSWGAGWSANVWNTYCELQRRYNIPFRSDLNRRGFLSGTVYDQAFLRFTVTTRTHGDVITENDLDKFQFGMMIYPDKRPIPADQKILAANIGGHEVEATANIPAGIQAFTLDKDKATQLFQRFIDNQIVEFTIRFANGDGRSFNIYPSGDRNFHVWAAMFQACISQNRSSQEPNAVVVDPPSGVLSDSLLITSQGVTASATAGNQELSEYNDAKIILSVQNLHTGQPVVSIAPARHTGNSRARIELPDGWALSTPVVPGGGCELQPIHLYNDGKGGYSLSVMTMSVYGACPWLKGEYAYRLVIETDEHGGGTVGKIVVR